MWLCGRGEGRMIHAGFDACGDVHGVDGVHGANGVDVESHRGDNAAETRRRQ